MGAPFEGSVLSKYHTARASISDLLYDIGHRVRYGAAVFPSKLRSRAVRGGRSDLPDGARRSGRMRGSRHGGADPHDSRPAARELPCRRRNTDFCDARSAPADALRSRGRHLGHSRDGRRAKLQRRRDLLGGRMHAQHREPDVGSRACTSSYNCCDPANTGPNAAGYCADIDATERAIIAFADRGSRRTSSVCPARSLTRRFSTAWPSRGNRARRGDRLLRRRRRRCPPQSALRHRNGRCPPLLDRARNSAGGCRPRQRLLRRRGGAGR